MASESVFDQGSGVDPCSARIRFLAVFSSGRSLPTATSVSFRKYFRAVVAFPAASAALGMTVILLSKRGQAKNKKKGENRPQGARHSRSF